MAKDQCDTHADWRTVDQLIQSQDYIQAAELLYTMQQAARDRSEPFVADAAAALHEICLACEQCRVEAEWHQRVGEEAEEREPQLRKHVIEILMQIGHREASTVVDEVSPLSRTAVNAMQSESRMNIAWWRQLQVLFERELHSIAIDGDEHTTPVLEAMTWLALSVARNIDKGFAAPESSFATQTGEAMDMSLAETSISEQDASETIVTTAADTSSSQAKTANESGTPILAVYCLGLFQVYQDDQLIEEWPSSKGLSIFKYLILHRERPVAKEVLMELFWPETASDAARNNLNVAIYGLRRALGNGRHTFSHILFRQDCYLLNPDLCIWVDVEEFAQHFSKSQRLQQEGELIQAISEYHAAEALYQGELLKEDRYEDWLWFQRQRLQDDYLDILDRLSEYYLDQQAYAKCILFLDKLLAIDPCQEDAHRRLMRCYSQQGNLHLALRQYDRCVKALARELDIGPDESTTALYEKLRRQR